jgi:hypothetical protein
MNLTNAQNCCDGALAMAEPDGARPGHEPAATPQRAAWKAINGLPTVT